MKISINELIKLFEENNIIKNGALSVFGDSIGKPGDIIYKLSYIKNNDINIEFGFKGVKILVYHPNFIVSNEKMICIKYSKKIEWIDKNIHLVYNQIENELKTEIIIGKHFFRTKNNENALLFYTW